jgi:hypothetical protein
VNINMIGVPTALSIASLSSDIPFTPEFGAYVLDPNLAASTSENTLNATISAFDFTRDLTNFKTFLNLDVMRSFYDAYASNNMAMMSNRFGFNDWDQVILFHNYVESLTINLLQQQGEYQVIPLASIMNQHTNATLNVLTEGMSLDVTARVIASKIKAAGTSCTDFFTNKYVSVNEDQATINCNEVDLTNVNTVKGWLNATWFGDSTTQPVNPAATKFITDNSLTPTQYNAFFFMDPTTIPDAAGNFGDLYQQAITEIATQYSCAATSVCTTGASVFSPPDSCRNCTAIELSSLQWGSIGVTNNPKSDWDATFLPKQTTVAGWGNALWEPFGPMTDFIEYPQCTAAQEKDWVSLPWAASQAMASSDWTAGGLTDKWAW